MKAVDELDYYELLEIAPGASPGDIDRAYRLAMQTFSEGSLATYSILESLDVADIRSKIDEAHRVLADPDARALYDRERFGGDPAAKGSFEPERDGVGEALAAPGPAAAAAAVHDAYEDVLGELDGLEEEPGGEFDGLRLRRARLFRGYELEDITEVTKVSGSHLRNIEDENFRDLPADVYVRGFVTAYARTIGLDPSIVVPSYMARLQESRSAGARSRLRGRR